MEFFQSLGEKAGSLLLIGAIRLKLYYALRLKSAIPRVSSIISFAFVSYPSRVRSERMYWNLPQC